MLSSRNVQTAELKEIAQAWGNVAGVVVHEPRLSRAKGVQREKLKLAAPEMFNGTFPVPSRRIFGWKDTKSIHYLETKQFLDEALIETGLSEARAVRAIGCRATDINVGTSRQMPMRASVLSL